MKPLFASCCLSTVIAISFFTGSLIAQAQEIQSPDTSTAQSVQPVKPAEDRNQAARDSQPAKPEPLSDEETSKLAARSQEPGPEVAGGALSNLHLTYIVIALAAAVIVLIAK